MFHRVWESILQILKWEMTPHSFSCKWNPESSVELLDKITLQILQGQYIAIRSGCSAMLWYQWAVIGQQNIKDIPGASRCQDVSIVRW